MSDKEDIEKSDKSSKEEKITDEKGNKGLDRTNFKRRASELKISEIKKIQRSESSSSLEEPTVAKTDSVGVLKALKRERSMSGQLGKETKGWRAKLMKSHTNDRTFTIENGVLTYSGGKNKEASFKIPLDEIKATKLDIKNDVKKGRFAFQISSTKRVFVLYANTEEEREDWLKQLRPRQEGEGDASPNFSKILGEFKVVVGKEYEWVIQGIDKYGKLCIEGGNKVQVILEKKPYVKIMEKKKPEIQEKEKTDQEEKEKEKEKNGTQKKKMELSSNNSENHEESLQTIDFKDLGDGTYKTFICPKETCRGKLRVEIDGESIKGSPFDFEFIPGPPSLKHSYIEGDGLHDTKMYINSKIRVSIYDQLGNPSPGVIPTVRILTKEGNDANFEIKMETSGEEVYVHHVTYIADRQGEFNVLVSVNGENWGEFPVVIAIAPASPGKSSATGPGLKKVYQYKQTTFKVSVNDERGRKCLGDHKITCQFFSTEGKNLGNFDTKITKNEDDTWSVSYVPAVGGSVLLHVLLYDQEVQGSPFSVDVAPAKGAIDKCKISGPGLTTTRIYDPTKCTVTVNDQMGRSVNQADVGVAFGGKQAEWHITDNGDGTFDIHFTPISPGLLIMTVTVDGKQIKGSPFQLNICESAELMPSMCYAEGAGVKECIQYRRANFSVFLRDQKNNPVSKGIVDVYLKGTDKFQYSMASASAGSYWVRYKTTADPGEYKLYVTVDGELIKGSPFFLSVEPGNPDDETPLDAGFPRLIRLSAQGKYLTTTLVPLSPSSLSSSDVFLLDNELTVYQYNGKTSSRLLKLSAGQIIKVLNYDRRSAVQYKIVEDTDHAEATMFWQLMGAEGHAPIEVDGEAKDAGFIPRCLVVNEDECIKLLAEGPSIKPDLLHPDQLIILDTGFEVFVWEGHNCNNLKKKYAYQVGKDYIKQYKRPEGILVHHILDGSSNWTLNYYLENQNVI